MNRADVLAEAIRQYLDRCQFRNAEYFKLLYEAQEILAGGGETEPESWFKLQFCSAVRAMVSGGPFDLTDSPKSLVGNLRRLIHELDVAEGRIPDSDSRRRTC